MIALQEHSIENTASAIKKMVIGCIIAEYGMRQLLDSSKNDLKQRVKLVLSACKKVQDWFLFHPDGGSSYKEVFEKEFLKNEIILIAELLELVWGIDERSLEEIINAIRLNMEEVLVTSPGT